MNNNLTEIVLILDSSGSMQPIQADTLGGINTFISEQKKVPGEANLSLVLFNTNITQKFNSINIQSVNELAKEDYKPDGGTALFDAIGITINEIGRVLVAKPESQRPGKVIFAIMTDGEENRSKEFTREKIFSMITEQREKYSWEFIFLGANQDAISAGSSIGIRNNINYNTANTEGLYASVSNTMTSYRSTGHISQEDIDDLGRNN